ncbi:MAG: hypothetical protein U1F36_01720 [Planctomycetota bacterium]
MRHIALLSLSLLAAAPMARGTAQDPQPSRVLPAAPSGSAFRLPRAGEQPLVDVRTDGRIFVGAEDYKAGFDRRGATFVPFLGSQAPHDWPVTLHAKRVTVGGKELACTEADPVRREGAVDFPRGGLVERYLLRGDGLEQTFGFETLPQRGEIVVSVGVETQMEVEPAGDGHRFRCADGSFEYGAATAIDAVGNAVAARTRWTGEAMEITVPETFVAQAVLPLWIDPLVYSVHSLPTATRELRTPDIAWDASADRGTVCWERVFSATDRDVYVAFCSPVMVQIGATQVIDLSTNDWHGARVAANEEADVSLVVVQADPVGGGASSIQGCRISGVNDPVVGAAFQIAANAINPCVGGTRHDIFSVGFLVAYEYLFSATDHDIHAQSVTAAGSLNGSFVVIDGSTLFEERPEISTSCGDGPLNSAAWAIVHRRRTGPSSGGMLVTYFGATTGVRVINGTKNFAIQSPVPLDDLSWAVSSPTADSLGRTHMFAMQLPGVGSSKELRQLLLSSTGTIEAVVTSHRVYDYGKLDIDSDGCRFALAYETLDHSTAAPLGIQLETFAHTASGITSQDLVVLPNTANQHRAPRLAAKRDGVDSQYGVVWAEMPAASTWQIAMGTYSGVQAGPVFSLRPTGCGPTPISWSASIGTFLGGTLTLDASQNNNGFIGWFAGLPANVPLGICPGCTLGTDLMLVLSGDLQQIHVPCDGNLVGGSLSFQPFMVSLPGPGLCLSNITLGHTLDITIR